MTRTRLPQLGLVLVLLLAICAVGLIQVVAETTGAATPQLLDLFRRTPTAAGLRAYETDLEQNSWCGNRIRVATQLAAFVTFRDLGAKALIGRDGWLFYRPGLEYVLEPCDGLAEAAAAIVAFRDALAERGIKLLVVPAPEKPSIYPERLGLFAQGLKKPMATHTTRLIETLRNNGVECTDLFSTFAGASGKPLYLVQDTHWAPGGMRLAAETVARRLAELGWVSPGQAVYDLKPVNLLRQGDIVEMVQNPAIAERFEPEPIVCEQVIDAEQTPYKDAAESPVLVLGDSFLRIYERDEPGAAGFVAHLARELRMPLASIINDGGGSTLVRQELYRKPELLKGKRVVVWEFAERDIRFGVEGWQRVPLPE
ncbi:MAG: hypothetical protein NTZ09_02610 [Candidatus Hydrogenedentes bacterium]|nr:hypothetical protein [Candidatus Hydrogenedentota bacterium]